MSTPNNQPEKTTNAQGAFWVVALLIAVAVGYSTRPIWSPRVDDFVASFRSDNAGSMHHGHAGHDEPEDAGHA